jgi:hypothetical protein
MTQATTNSSREVRDDKICDDNDNDVFRPIVKLEEVL